MKPEGPVIWTLTLLENSTQGTIFPWYLYHIGVLVIKTLGNVHGCGYFYRCVSVYILNSGKTSNNDASLHLICSSAANKWRSVEKCEGSPHLYSKFAAHLLQERSCSQLMVFTLPSDLTVSSTWRRVRERESMPTKQSILENKSYL